MVVFIIAVLLTTLKPVFAENRSDYLDSALDPRQARVRIQAGYADSTAREIALALYEEKNGIPAEMFEQAVEELLGNGEDFLIGRINYEPAFYFEVVMRGISPVAQTLQGEAFVYSLEITEEIPIPADDPASVGADTGMSGVSGLLINTYLDIVIRYCSKPDPGNARDCLGVVAEYCTKPAGYRFPMPRSFSDEEWCPAWHSFVMPPRADAGRLENPSSLEQLPAFVTARTRIQADNALRTGREIANALGAYREKYAVPISEEAFAWFAGELLGKGEDPMIACIDYAPEDRFGIELRNGAPVAEALQGRVLTYRLEGGKWLLAEQEKQSPVCQTDLFEAPAIGADETPDPLVDTYLDIIIRHCSRPNLNDARGCLAVAAGYCKSPRGYQFQEGANFLSDKDWCPAWNEFIMPV
ncbi:MAG: hypothetical protein GY862_28520 [Gammaproteobacteria bacterium]|nr:hypothetical protein [Gammaproteobacteria bacterium]